jgi:hypothetical protein
VYKFSKKIDKNGHKNDIQIQVGALIQISSLKKIYDMACPNWNKSDNKALAPSLGTCNLFQTFAVTSNFS